MRLALVFASIKLCLHLVTNLWQAHIGWGYFGDEMYYILCGRHLAWGYVDHGPLVAVQANVALALFGKSLAGIRMLSSLAGAGRVFLTGILAWSLGGRRPAQDLSMNSFESLFWMGCLLAILRMQQGGSQRLWLVFGLLAGLGLLNKPSMAFFLVALLATLLLSPQRRLLWNRWAVAGFVLLLLIALPNVLWQARNHWPTLEFLNHARLEATNLGRRNPFFFMGLQSFYLNLLNLPLWVAGIVWLVVSPQAKQYRWIGWMYLLFIAIMIVLRAKAYYVTPVYPVLFAAGGIAWERYFSKHRRVVEGYIFAFPAYEGALVFLTTLALPVSFPILQPNLWITYAKRLRTYELVNRGSPGLLPEFYADRFGWQEETDEVSRIYRSLSPEDRAKVGIFCQDYGQASGINFLGNGLPFAISGHNNYYLWGPHGKTGEVMILLTNRSLDDLRKEYASVEVAGRVDNPYSMPFQQIDVYIARGRKTSLLTGWTEVKHY